ncbi:MAG: dehydrogenase [Verrucomicrobiota bacterium]|nr:dehydrogenase [Verrucomicrobiota bacterium]
MRPFFFFPGTLCLACILFTGGHAQGVLPALDDGTALNFGFESGDLTDWLAEGAAFEKQPIRGDTVSIRRQDMKSGHEGDYWIGTYEAAGDDLKGTLTSSPFMVTHPFASFRISGGRWLATRVELVDARNNEVFFKASGLETEDLRPVIVDLKRFRGEAIFIRIVDQQAGHWGHINFDDFRFHAARPVFPDVIDPEVLSQQFDVSPMDDVIFAGLNPQAAVDAMTLPDGFKAHVFAAEPDVTQPIAFCFDARGRLWVAEGHQYPRRAEGDQGRDRIFILEDLDGDHHFDKKTLFMDNLNLVSGLEVGFGGVWIGAAPYLMFVPDLDHDDQPDGAPEILLDGWDPYRDTHETLNTFSWGPDGWLYGCHGVFCPSMVGRPGTPMEERQRVDAAVWRYHPTKHLFEVFAEGTSNPWGLDFNGHGQAFIEACVIPHFWHIIQGARYQRQGGQHYSITLAERNRVRAFLAPNAPDHLHPFIYDDIKTHGDHVHWSGNRGPHAANNRSDQTGGGHAHSGLMMYQGGSWPPEYDNQAFMNNIHGQRINMDRPTRSGSGFVGKHGPDFLYFNDRWSQVLNLLYDHNGSVYMIDWYDANQCHHRREDGHDRSNGRIFKVVHDHEPQTSVNLLACEPSELLRFQLHENQWYAQQARKILMEKGGSRRLKRDIRRLFQETPSIVHKLRLMWTLGGLDGFTQRFGLNLMRHSNEYIRAWAIQLLWEDKAPSRAMMEALAEMASSEPSAFVRLYIASALQRTPVQERFPVLKSLIAHTEDAGDHNLPLMYWYAMEPVVGVDQELGLALLQASRIPILRQYIARRMTTGALVEAH